MLLITKIPKNFLGYSQAIKPSKTIEKSLAFLDRSSGYKTQGVLSSFCTGLGTSAFSQLQ